MEIALLIWALALTVLLVVGVLWIFDLQGRIHQLQQYHEGLFTEDEDADSKAMLERLTSRLSETTARTERLTSRADRIDATLARTVQAVGLVRYQAYEHTGGDQSFSLALTNGEGNGVVISALYGRDATRVYAKPVEKWLSNRQLTEEEEEALKKARQTVT